MSLMYSDQTVIAIPISRERIRHEIRCSTLWNPESKCTQLTHTNYAILLSVYTILIMHLLFSCPLVIINNNNINL